MPHFTQSWVRGKKRAGGLAGRGRCCPGAEGAQSPELRQPGAAAGSAGCPAAGRGRQTPRRRRGMLRTALPDRPQRPEGQSAGTQPAESGWHSVLHGPGLLQVLYFRDVAPRLFLTQQPASHGSAHRDRKVSVCVRGDMDLPWWH